MSNEVFISEYRYMDEMVKKHRTNSLKKFLLEDDKSELSFYDLNMYVKDNDFKSKVLSQMNKSLINNEIVLNRFQIEILNILNNNNLFLSAPTSFGKTFLMLEYIKRNQEKLNNIIFIIPTLALMNELLKKIYTIFASDYNICINASEEFKEKNIFVFVPERSDSEFLNKVQDLEIDFLVFDEIYKLQALKNSDVKTDDRLIFMNKVYLDLVSKSKKIALLGPYINNVSFNKTNLNIIKYYTNYLPVYNKIKVLEDNQEWVNYINLDHQLIYFSSPASIYRNIDKILTSIPEDVKMIQKYARELKYLEETISKDWYVVSLLKRGIGIHHGKTPMYLRKFYENEYNKGNLKVLLCTNTLMEGINTPTNSMIIVDDPGSAFKLNNLIGRVGRLNVKSPTIGEIIISSSSILNNITNSNGWFDLKILAEEENIVSDDEVIYLNKKYSDVKKQNVLDEKVEFINQFGVSVDNIIDSNLQVNKTYEYFKNQIFEDLSLSSDFVGCVKSGLLLINGPSYLFHVKNFQNLNYKGSYLPYKYYLSYLLGGYSYKQLIDQFNIRINPTYNMSNINVFIDALFELSTFIRFKYSKLVQYIGLYETEKMKNNKELQKFIGVLSSYKSFATAYKILDDLGISEEDSKKIIELLKIQNVTSTSFVIKLIKLNKNLLLKQDLTPFTLNNIESI